MSRQAFEEWFNDFHIEEMPNYQTIRDFSFAAYQTATDAALERAADEVSIVDSKTWFGNQLAFGIACRKAIRALKETP